MVMKQKMDADSLQEKIDKETEAMELKMLDAKPWFLKGEISAADRHENAILEGHLDVQRHGLLKPPSGDNEAIKAYVIKAIKEQSFDSPAFKSAEKLAQLPHTKPLQDVAPKSLVEDYEEVMMRNKELEKDQGDPVKNAIQAEILELFEQLDGLSKLHFVPRKHEPEIHLLQNQPALAMEEAGPMVTSTATLLAPEEVCQPRGELIKGVSELTSTDRRRHRRKLMRIRAKRRRLNAKDPLKDKQAAMAKVIKMAHRPNSHVKIIS